MPTLPAALLLLPVSLLLLVGLVPSGFANRRAVLFRGSVTVLAGFQLLAAAVSGIWAMVNGPWSWRLLDGSATVQLPVSLYFDGISGLMLLLVSFVGLIVCRFSLRYLDGEAAQGRYFRWIGFTLGAVSLMVVAGNLLLFFLAWISTSLGLHQLLLHYPERPAARRAAWTKFAISRLGDVFLIVAVVLTYKTFNTVQFADLFSMLSDASTTRAFPLAATTIIGWLLVLGAVTKSAQFPFHIWLPDTMETPTPVSALMHAGIVNAGGYLVIRMSPLIAQAPSALTTLAVIGAVTACLAAVAMTTQSSVKQGLAYSTISQMGLMMLQCGLGAFTAAMLHILAHSLYKAHAFLSSGSVLSQSLAMEQGKPSPAKHRSTSAGLVAALVAVMISYLSISYALGLDLTTKPGGYVLACILCLALISWIWQVLVFATPRTAIMALAGVAGLSLAYTLGYLATDRLVASAVPFVPLSGLAVVTTGMVATAFFLLFALHATILQRYQAKWLEAWRVHACNGFYIDVILRRAFALRIAD